MSITRFLAIALVAALAFGLIGCTGKRDRIAEGSPEYLYTEATRMMNARNYAGAAEVFERLESRHPFSRQAQQAQLDIIYAYYRAHNFDSAQAASDRFLREQPRHPNIDYAHYLRGLINFDRNVNLLDRALRVDPAHRDPSTALRSYNSFRTLVTSYPDSIYVSDAKQRMVHLRNQLARYEIHVAEHYMDLGAWVAAANRARTVVEEYQDTPSSVDGLVILHNAYRRMHLDDLADDVARVLAANFPDAQDRLRR